MDGKLTAKMADCEGGWLWSLKTGSSVWWTSPAGVNTNERNIGKFYVQLVFHSFWQNHKKGPRSKSSSRQRQPECCTSSTRPNANYGTSSGWSWNQLTACPWTWLWRAWRLLQYRIISWLQMQINENKQPEHVYDNNQRTFCLEVTRPSSFQCTGWWQCYIQSCKT